MRSYFGVALVVIGFLFVEGRHFNRAASGGDGLNVTCNRTLPMNCVLRIQLHEFYNRFPDGPINATVQPHLPTMYDIIGKTFRFYKVIGDKGAAMEEMTRMITRLVWRTHTSCAPVRFHQIISIMASQSLQRNQFIRDKIKEKLMPLAFGFEMEFAKEVLRETDAMILVPYRRISDALFTDLQKAILMVLRKTEKLIEGTEWRTEATQLFETIGNTIPSVKRCISMDEVVQVHRQFIDLITKIVNRDLQTFLKKIKEITTNELNSIAPIASNGTSQVVDDIANILEQHIKDFVKQLAVYENAIAARNFSKIRSLLAMILPAHDVMYVDKVIKMLENPIPGTGTPVRRGGRPRPTGRTGPVPTGYLEAPVTTESVEDRILDQLEKHKRNVQLDRIYNEENDQADENEFHMNFNRRRLGRTTVMPDSDIMDRGRPTGGPSPPPFPGNTDNGREALKEFIWNLTTVFPSGPMSDTFNLGVKVIVEKIKTAFQQYPAVTAGEILNGLYLDLGISILTKKSKCPASKFAHVIIYMLRKELEDDLSHGNDSLKSDLAKILSTTNLTNPDDYAESMVYGLHHSILREMTFETARSMTKDTHRTLMFLRKKLLKRVSKSKPVGEAFIKKIVRKAVQKFPRVRRCITAKKLIEWHKNQKTEFDEMKKHMNLTAEMEIIRQILTSSLKNMTGDDYPAQVESMVGILELHVEEIMDLAEKFYDHMIAQDMDKMVALFDDYLDDTEKNYFKEILKKLGFTSTGPDDKRELNKDDVYANIFDRYYQ